jgi:hypothetical protein
MQDLRTELQEAVDEAQWSWLEPHAQRGSVIFVSSDLDLVDVGVAIANDNTLHVQHWIEEALIQKPSSIQLFDWTQQQNKRFNALIVQPYVLIQELGRCN